MAFWREKMRIFDVNVLAGKNQTFRECLSKNFRGKTTEKFYGCFLGKTSLYKNFQMILRGGGRGEPSKA